VQAGIQSVQGVTAAVSSISVVSPNGGESFQRGTTQTITWNYSGNVGGSVRIELIKSGGALWSTISANAPIGAGGIGAFNWTIPSVLAAASDYKIKITSTSNATVRDSGDAFFSLSQ
jgi:hypothetical protein